MSGRGIWLTSNGGHAWRKVAPPRGTGFIYEQGSSVEFADPQHGWISLDQITGYWPHRGDRWMFARTTDGGRTWTPSFPADCHGHCGGGSMSFLDARHGFLLADGPGVGTPNELLRTVDGGRTWQPVAKTSMWGPITFLNSRVGFAFRSGNEAQGPYVGPPIGTLYRTTDGGRTWAEYDIGGSKSFVEEPVTVVDHHVVVVQNGPSPKGGTNLAPGTVYVSADGQNWSGSAVPATRVDSAFSAASANVWSFASGGVVYTTTDAGRHWRRISLSHRKTRFPRPIWRLKPDFTSSQIGWTVLGHTLYRTTDGGVHWAKAGPAKGKPINWSACDPAQLTVSLWLSLSHENPIAHLSVRNAGRLACRLSGWPTVVAVTADGRTIKAKRTLLLSRRVRRLVIGSADARLEGVDLRRGSTCPRVVRLEVTPPGGRTATTLVDPWRASYGRNFNFPVCGGLSVTPLARR
jgi:photosystem II stability/assembly factor-like uncharacterized protein